MHHPILCLRGPLLTNIIRRTGAWKSGPLRRPPGGRFWHGFAVRTAACRGARTRPVDYGFRGSRRNSLSGRTSSAEEMESNADPHNDKLLSPEEVARFCGLSRRAVYRAISRGELHAARLCNRLRIRPTELDRWIGERVLDSEQPRVDAATPGRPAPRGGLRALLDEAPRS